MTLISSISGIRGTIGGRPGDNLTPADIIRFTTAFGRWVIEKTGNRVVVVGRDARISGEMVNRLVCGTLQSIGINVVDLGLSTTPTVEIAVPLEKAGGGIILTASHNPKHWNALKLLNDKGEFLSAADGAEVLALTDSDMEFSTVDEIGEYQTRNHYIRTHIDQILALDMVDVKAIRDRRFRIVIDCVNSTGGISVPELLHALGVTDLVELFCAPNGRFPHNPEPLPENLGTIAQEVKLQKADLGIVVDPDVDRLALVCEDGEMFGEEYTLVAVADYVLRHRKGPTVSNLSSTQALGDVAEKHGVKHYQAAVGEVNVVTRMKAVGSVIGGEGNGGIILPELHYGRDALVGIALFLSHLAKYGKSASMLRASYPNYFMAKKKMDLPEGVSVQSVLDQVAEKYTQYPQNKEDGLKITMDKEWVHLRASNTEPIVRIYAESDSPVTAENIAARLMQDMSEITK
ncbi:MAG: phosphoglucosamine mutase [Chitinophagales bacterium]|nr:phosphoglucosamine mutase [Chitinophagales bacterium]MCB9032079.1 phosphoglucosamine mutase [Chitinophagales bacterium]